MEFLMWLLSHWQSYVCLGIWVLVALAVVLRMATRI